MKPRLFIGSSREQLEVVDAIETNLADDADICKWSLLFSKGETVFHQLLGLKDRLDFAILVLNPDDQTRVREKDYNAIRDNTIFELGLFLGALGNERVFPVADVSLDAKIMSDFGGVLLYTYNSRRGDRHLPMAVSPACNEIRRRIKTLGPRRRGQPQYAAAAIPDRHQEVFELSEAGKMRHRWYPRDLHDPDSDWSEWAEMPCAPSRSHTAVGQRDRLDVFVLTVEGAIEQRTWQLEGDANLPPRERSGHWGNWRRLPAAEYVVTGPIRSVSHTSGHLELFAFDGQDLVHRWSWKDEWSNPWRKLG